MSEFNPDEIAPILVWRDGVQTFVEPDAEYLAQRKAAHEQEQERQQREQEQQAARDVLLTTLHSKRAEELTADETRRLLALLVEDIYGITADEGRNGR